MLCYRVPNSDPKTVLGNVAPSYDSISYERTTDRGHTNNTDRRAEEQHKSSGVGEWGGEFCGPFTHGLMVKEQKGGEPVNRQLISPRRA
jgi:hypothetical protein